MALPAIAAAFVLMIVLGCDSHDSAGSTRTAALAKGDAGVVRVPGTERKTFVHGLAAVPAPAALDPMSREYAAGVEDVLFSSGRADLKPAAIGNLSRLVTFLARYRDRSLSIQGHTDSLGDEEGNQELSERRANSIKAYLVSQGIESTRLLAIGKGQSDPIAGNDSRAGRQQNRRAEVIIKGPPVKDPAGTLPQRPRTERVIVLLMLLQSVSGQSGRPFL
jgi:outer membrane protein OmpA-like peptidoglycan-associated protein